MTTVILAALIAAIPIFIWALIFYNIRPTNKWLLVFAFIAGCFSPVIVLLYQKFWGTSMNLIFFEITPINFKTSLTEFSSDYFLQNFLVFVFGVGMMEEFVKHFVVRKEKPAGLVVVGIFLLLCATIYGVFKLIAGIGRFLHTRRLLQRPPASTCGRFPLLPTPALAAPGLHSDSNQIGGWMPAVS